MYQSELTNRREKRDRGRAGHATIIELRDNNDATNLLELQWPEKNTNNVKVSVSKGSSHNK